MEGIVAVPDWIWFIFIFVTGCCIGSFLNVVIYRLPRDKSIITPPSACPACGKHIHFYDNIPLISWLVLGRKCRYCKAPISPRYFIIELLTGVVFLVLFILYFRTELREGIKPFWGGGWLIYLISIIMLSAFIAASAIDLELWVIPLSVCWLVTAAGLLNSAIGGYIIDPKLIRAYLLLPTASAETGALSIGALIGLVISWIFLATGLIKRSYESQDSQNEPEKPEKSSDFGKLSRTEPRFNHRLEICKEIIFLLPIIICSGLALWIISGRVWWVDFTQHPVISGLLGSLWGYFVGCGIVWVTRILGTLAFGKEAMGLGDVHLMVLPER